MKQQSQSNELTGSLIASESEPIIVDTSKESAPKKEEATPPTRDFMYNWIREKSGKK
jgi:hypothetical protein